MLARSSAILLLLCLGTLPAIPQMRKQDSPSATPSAKNTGRDRDEAPEPEPAFLPPEFKVPADAVRISLGVPITMAAEEGSQRWFLLKLPARIADRFVLADLVGTSANIDMDLYMTGLDGRLLSSATGYLSNERVFAEMPADRFVALMVYTIPSTESDGQRDLLHEFTLSASTSSSQPYVTVLPDPPRTPDEIPPEDEPEVDIPPPPDTTPILRVLLSGQDAAAYGTAFSPTAIAVSPGGSIVLATGDNLFDVAGRRFLQANSSDVNDCAYDPSGALLAVSGRSLGFYAGGVIESRMTLPEPGMKVVAARDALYLYGGERRSGLSLFGGARQSTALYMIDPERGHVKLLDMPLPILAGAAFGDTLYFSVSNDVYRFSRARGLQMLCRIPGPVITSLAAGDREDVYFTAARSLYVWRGGQVALVSSELGDLICWHSSGLHVLDTRSRSLVRLENLP